MVKKIKFSLKLKGERIGNINDLREHFDAIEVMSYFYEGKLDEWLYLHKYCNEAKLVEDLKNKDGLGDEEIILELSKILDVKELNINGYKLELIYKIAGLK